MHENICSCIHSHANICTGRHRYTHIYTWSIDIHTENMKSSCIFIFGMLSVALYNSHLSLINVGAKIYLTIFEKTDHLRAFCILRNTNLKYLMHYTFLEVQYNIVTPDILYE